MIWRYPFRNELEAKVPELSVLPTYYMFPGETEPNVEWNERLVAALAIVNKAMIEYNAIVQEKEVK